MFGDDTKRLIRVVLAEPGKPARIVDIDGSAKSVGELLGATIESGAHFTRVLAKPMKIMGGGTVVALRQYVSMKANRGVPIPLTRDPFGPCGVSLVRGAFFIVNSSGDPSLSDRLAHSYVQALSNEVVMDPVAIASLEEDDRESREAWAKNLDRIEDELAKETGASCEAAMRAADPSASTPVIVGTEELAEMGIDPKSIHGKMRNLDKPSGPRPSYPEPSLN